jgi:hypothetical protein
VRKIPVDYRTREPILDAWIAHGYQREATTRLLVILSRAFGFSEREGLHLRPDDEVWALYRRYYPPLSGWWRQIDMRTDELEIETLERTLRKLLPPGRSVDLHLSVTVGDLVRLLET